MSDQLFAKRKKSTCDYNCTDIIVPLSLRAPAFHSKIQTLSYSHKGAPGCCCLEGRQPVLAAWPRAVCAHTGRASRESWICGTCSWEHKAAILLFLRPQTLELLFLPLSGHRIETHIHTHTQTAESAQTHDLYSRMIHRVPSCTCIWINALKPVMNYSFEKGGIGGGDGCTPPCRKYMCPILGQRKAKFFLWNL